MNKMAILEGLLYLVGNDGISIDRLTDILEIEESEVNYLISKLKEKYESDESAFNIEYIADKYMLTTKSEHKEYYKKLVEIEKTTELPQSTLETLAVIAYNSPTTRHNVDEIRGVDSSYQIRKLLFRNLIKEVGRSEMPGHPMLYSVTDEFLDYLGLASIKDLPDLPEKEPEIIEDTDLYQSKYTENF